MECHNLPAPGNGNVDADNRAQDQTHIGNHSPKKDQPYSILGIKHILNTTGNHYSRDSGEEPREKSTDHNSSKRGNYADYDTGDTVQAGAKEVKPLAAERF